MIPTLPISYQNLSGIPITGPFAHPADARQTLATMSASYPREIFNVEFADEDDAAVVTWIPSAYVGYFLSSVLFNSATGRDWDY